MRFGESGEQLHLAIGLRPALFEIGKVLEEVSEQIWEARAGLAQGRGHNASVKSVIDDGWMEPV